MFDLWAGGCTLALKLLSLVTLWSLVGPVLRTQTGTVHRGVGRGDQTYNGQRVVGASAVLSGRLLCTLQRLVNGANVLSLEAAAASSETQQCHQQSRSQHGARAPVQARVPGSCQIIAEIRAKPNALGTEI